MSIHINFSEEDAKYSKQILLESQLALLKSLKKQINYSQLRKKEFSIKISLKSKLNQIFQSVKTLQNNLPSIREEKMNTKKNFDDNRIEYELKEIQGKLKSFQNI